MSSWAPARKLGKNPVKHFRLSAKRPISKKKKRKGSKNATTSRAVKKEKKKQTTAIQLFGISETR